MRKLMGISLVMLMVLTITPMISANVWDRFWDSSKNVGVIQKNPVSWTEIRNGAKGNVLLSQKDKAHAILLNAKPYTEYTLIYYGFQNETVSYNDVWNYATCITNGTTNNNGNVRMTQMPFNYWGFVQDADLVKQKFWIVLSSDVDCTSHRMTAWQPTEYLFEREVI